MAVVNLMRSDLNCLTPRRHTDNTLRDAGIRADVIKEARAFFDAERPVGMEDGPDEDAECDRSGCDRTPMINGLCKRHVNDEAGEITE